MQNYKGNKGERKVMHLPNWTLLIDKVKHRLMNPILAKNNPKSMLTLVLESCQDVTRGGQQARAC